MTSPRPPPSGLVSREGRCRAISTAKGVSRSWASCEARAVAGDAPTYISFDVDGLDPAYAPGTGTPETGGLLPREAQAILHGLKRLDIIGGDVVEAAPQYDATTNTDGWRANAIRDLLARHPQPEP